MKLKKFNLPDNIIFRTVQRQFSRAGQSEHKSVYGYGPLTKKAAQDCTNTGKNIDDRMLKNFFTQGLNADPEAYIIPREQITEDNGKTLTLDKMIKAHVEFETRMKDQESESNAIAQRVAAKNSYRNIDGRDKAKDSNKKDKKKKKPCPLEGISGLCRKGLRSGIK